MKSFGGIYAGRRVLVTGHTGFKGSWLAYWLRELGATVRGVALAPSTSPSHWELLGLNDVEDIRADIREADAVNRAICQWRPEVVFHLAAQPLVRRSYREPVETFATNVTGLVNVLEAVRKTPSVVAVINATTDKVYAARPDAQPYKEDDPLGGHDPYSTSKACAELVTESYRKSFFQNGPCVATARAGNVIGGGDWADDRLVPDMVRAMASGTPIVLRNPRAVRPWQHVLEPLSGYLRLGQAMLSGSVKHAAWNFGPSNDADLPVSSVIAALHGYWPAVTVMEATDPQPHEASILRLDGARAEHELGWRAVWHADETLRRTAGWYNAWYDSQQLSTSSDLAGYVADAQLRGDVWAA